MYRSQPKILLRVGANIDLVLYTEIFSSFEELERQRKNYIDFELSKFKEYIINLESQFLNQDSRQFIIDVIEGILK